MARRRRIDSCSTPNSCCPPMKNLLRISKPKLLMILAGFAGLALSGINVAHARVRQPAAPAPVTTTYGTGVYWDQKWGIPGARQAEIREEPLHTARQNYPVHDYEMLLKEFTNSLKEKNKALASILRGRLREALLGAVGNLEESKKFAKVIKKAFVDTNRLESMVYLDEMVQTSLEEAGQGEMVKSHILATILGRGISWSWSKREKVILNLLRIRDEANEKGNEELRECTQEFADEFRDVSFSSAVARESARQFVPLPLPRPDLGRNPGMVFRIPMPRPRPSGGPSVSAQ